MSARRARTQPFADRSRARKRALQALYQWELARQPVDDIVAQFRQEQDMTRVDVDYFVFLVTQAVADVEALDAAIAGHLDRPWAQVDPLEKSALRLGACELKHRLETPFRVVIDETVKLAGLFGSGQSATYVNAVLDRCAGDLRASEYAAR